MKCCICKNEIKPDAISGWDKGHNPYPVRDKGKCCGECNDTIVLPKRLSDYFITSPLNWQNKNKKLDKGEK